jgi:hypothetical protein
MDSIKKTRNIGDCFNPIVVKEMRQAVKGRFTTWTLMIFLAVQLTIIGMVLILSKDIGKDFSGGRGLFGGLSGVLLFVCLLILPVFTGFRLSSERSSNNVDLFFITTLKPRQIIWGKFFTSMITALLFFAAALPFLTLTYLFRGLDLPSIFVSISFLFLMVLAGIQFSIFLASLPGGMASRVMRFLFLLFVLFILFQSTLTVSIGLMYGGIGSAIGTWEFWRGALTVTTLVIIDIVLLFSLSVALISPQSANRAFGVRLCLLFTWLASGIVAFAWFFDTGNKDYLQTWVVVMVLMFGINMLSATCEHQKRSARVTRTIPKRLILRVPAFFLYSGPAGGIALSILMLITSLLLFGIFSGVVPSKPGVNHDMQETFLIAIGLSLYAVCYSLTALTVKRMFFRKSLKPRAVITGLLAFLLGGSILPVIIGFLLRQDPWQELPPIWYIGNPLVLFIEDKIWVECFTFTGIWAVVAFGAFLPWFIGQLRVFKPDLK